jgi:hypothetical protein
LIKNSNIYSPFLWDEEIVKMPISRGVAEMDDEGWETGVGRGLRGEEDNSDSEAEMVYGDDGGKSSEDTAEKARFRRLFGEKSWISGRLSRVMEYYFQKYAQTRITLWV